MPCKQASKQARKKQGESHREAAGCIRRCRRRQMRSASVLAPKALIRARHQLQPLLPSVLSSGRNWLVAFGLLQQALQTQLRISQARPRGYIRLLASTWQIFAPVMGLSLCVFCFQGYTGRLHQSR